MINAWTQSIGSVDMDNKLKLMTQEQMKKRMHDDLVRSERRVLKNKFD